jgi:hypothetical protein
MPANEPHEVRAKILGSTVSPGARPFMDLDSAVAFARAEARKISRPAVIEVIERRTRRIKLRIEIRADGSILQTPFV